MSLSLQESHDFSTDAMLLIDTEASWRSRKGYCF